MPLEQSPRGHLDLMLLGLLAAHPGHGYSLIVRLREASDGVFDLPEGTVYPVLHKLQELGHITSDWDRTGPRPRRVYRITREGSRALAGQRQDWVRYRDAVGGVLGEKPWPATP